MNTARLIRERAIQGYSIQNEKIPLRRAKTAPNIIEMNVAEYFAGIGLVRMGLKPAGWEVIFANDNNSDKYEMYRAFFPGSERHYLIKNIFDVDPTEVPLTTLATCSFPCIDLSLAGKMNGFGGKHSSAFWGFIRILREQGESSPPIILLENVPGWLSSSAGADFRLTVKSLNDLGYKCNVFSLDALRFTPQSRLRIFLIGTKFWHRDQECDFLFVRSNSLITEGIRRALLTNRDLEWFNFQIPDPPQICAMKLSHLLEELDESDAKWWPESKANRHLKMMNETHLDRILDKIDGDKFTYRTFFRRIRQGKQHAEVRKDDFAGCLRTAIGGSGKQFLVRAGRGRVRMRVLTPREYARLQGVPDNYRIIQNGTKALTGFGDAVCVPVITWIAFNVLNPLYVEYVKSIRQSALHHG